MYGLNQNQEQLQNNQQIILHNPNKQILNQPKILGQDQCLQTQPIFHTYQSKTPLGKPHKQRVQTQIQNRPSQKIGDNRKFPSRARSLSP